MSNLSDTQFLENVQQGHMRYDPKKAVRFSNEVFYQLMTIRPSSDDPLYPRLTVRRGVGREFTRKSFRTEKKTNKKIKNQGKVTGVKNLVIIITKQNALDPRGTESTIKKTSSSLTDQNKGASCGSYEVCLLKKLCVSTACSTNITADLQSSSLPFYPWIIWIELFLPNVGAPAPLHPNQRTLWCLL